jgi:hypothetical protein
MGAPGPSRRKRMPAPTYHIEDEDRPYIEFRKVINRGISPRAARVDEKGKTRRPARLGEAVKIQRKYLIGHKRVSAFQEPYTWATKAWVVDYIKPDCEPIGYGNIDKLPPDYPADWRAKLLDCISAVAAQVAVRKKLEEAEAAALAKLAEAEAKLAQLEGKQDVEGQSEAVGRKSPKGHRRADGGSEEAPGTAG